MLKTEYAVCFVADKIRLPSYFHIIRSVNYRKTTYLLVWTMCTVPSKNMKWKNYSLFLLPALMWRFSTIEKCSKCSHCNETILFNFCGSE